MTNKGDGRGGPLTKAILFGDETERGGAGDQRWQEYAQQASPGAMPPGANAELLQYSLPSYPIALLIAKDITIKVTTSAGGNSVARSSQSHVQSAQGGFLCFSADSSSCSSSSSTNMSSFCNANTQTSRCPAPQVVGVWSQLAPADNSKVLDKKELEPITDALSFIGRYQQLHLAGRESRMKL